MIYSSNMRKRMKPSKEDILAEAAIALEYLLKVIPVNWKFAGFKIVNNRTIKSRADIDKGADGGPSYRLVYSMQELDDNWRLKVWTRTAHELTHVRLCDIEQDEDIEKMCETYCEISESLMMELYKSRSPHIDTTQAA
jgi:hypothetical protein